MKRLFVLFEIEVISAIFVAIILGIGLGVTVTSKAYLHASQEVAASQYEMTLLNPREIENLQQFARILWGESGCRPCVEGDMDRPYRAFGPAQWQERTFNEMKWQARMPWLEWKNPEHQLILTWCAVKNNKARIWTVVKEMKF